jgi:hypothetical protein
VPTAPALSSIQNVEIAQTGTWKISTGTATFTTEDFHAAVAALDCPAIRRPILKLGHVDPRFDGEPAVGWIDNLAVNANGVTVLGDYVGMPGWLGPVIASAYPDRSMEACWNFKCQIGHTHPFVITAVALLGVKPPGIGTLDSLQDVATLYGVAASVDESNNGFSLIVHAKGAEPMPNPEPRIIAAGISTEDIRREYYEEAASPSTWITCFELDPLQLIVMDDASGDISRIPITINGTEFTFGDPVPVVIQYVDSGVNPLNASALVYASRAESRPATRTEPVLTERQWSDVNPNPNPDTALTPAQAIAKVHKAASQVGTPETDQGGSPVNREKMREALGLSPDATDTEVATAFAASLQTATPAAPVTPSLTEVTASTRVPDGMMVVDASVISSLQDQARKGEAAFAEIQKNRRDTVISAAISSGKFPPARKEHYEGMWAADPVGAEATINNLAAGLVPVNAASGYPGTGSETFEQDETYYALYPEMRPANA